LTIDDGWLQGIIELAKADKDSALAKVSGSQLPPEEKQGISMALGGISALEGMPEQDRQFPSVDQLAKLNDGVLLEALDGAYVRTWMLYAKGLGVVKDEGGIKREDHEPEKEVGAPSLGVQLPLTAYGVADENPGDDHAQEVEDE
jgi:hypothetical protein